MLLLVYNRIDDTCKKLSSTLNKNNMDTKKVIPTITDVDTGEIIYQCKTEMCGKSEGYAYKTFNLGDFGATGEKFCQKVFDSFIRGIKLGRNLSLHITIRDYVLPKQSNLF